MVRISLIFTSLFFLCTLHTIHLFAQHKHQDTLLLKGNARADTSGKSLLALDTATTKKHDPKIATFRSAVIPGWGQAYNRKYWKIPIIYGALGTTTWIFFYNLKNYKLLRRAVVLKSDTSVANDTLIAPIFRAYGLPDLRTFRGQVRQDIDYSVLFFLIFWGVNVVDATVDAHLKAFDVSPDISMKLKPALSGSTPGVALVFFLHDNHHKAALPVF